MKHTSRAVETLSGLLAVNKPVGWTSHDVVKKVRSILSMDKVGHLGTLDPIASGVLPLCLGKATRVAQYLQEWDKEYAVTLKLGVSTDTQDATGTVVEDRPLSGLTEEKIRKAFESYSGEILQIPPMYSAKKVGGVPLYRLARRGKTVEREPRRVTIYRIAVESIDLPYVRFTASCSKGTYMRTICHDVGEALGVGGHLYGLVRTRSGIFVLEDAMTLEELKKQAVEGRVAEGLTPISTALSTFGLLRLNARGLAKARRRLMIFAEDLAESPVEAGQMSVFRLTAPDGALVGIARPVPDVGGYRVERLLS